MKTFTRLIAILFIAATLGACATYGTERAGVAGRPAVDDGTQSTSPWEKEKGKQSGPWPAPWPDHEFDD